MLDGHFKPPPRWEEKGLLAEWYRQARYTSASGDSQVPGRVNYHRILGGKKRRSRMAPSSVHVPCISVYFLNFLLPNTTNPTNPLPSRSNVEGSGTALFSLLDGKFLT